MPGTVECPRATSSFGDLSSLEVDLPNELLRNTVHGALKGTPGAQQLTKKRWDLKLVATDAKHRFQVHLAVHVFAQERDLSRFVRSDALGLSHGRLELCLFIEPEGIEPERPISRDLLESPLHDCNSSVKLLILLLELGCLVVDRPKPLHMAHEVLEHLSRDDDVPSARLEQCAFQNCPPGLVHTLVPQTRQKRPCSLQVSHSLFVLDGFGEKLLSEVTVLEALVEDHAALVKPAALLFHLRVLEPALVRVRLILVYQLVQLASLLEAVFTLGQVGHLQVDFPVNALRDIFTGQALLGEAEGFTEASLFLGSESLVKLLENASRLRSLFQLLLFSHGQRLARVLWLA
mmetsp:Transcript_6123/g.19820  ORF Transcript_6123/g.19820 Transcript_6123/m.19820 type:complete len:347 (+) Transcript_6123:1155-2195(+)